MPRTLTPIELPDVHGAEGKWVAIKDGRILGIEETPDRLYSYLHSKRLTGATILRVPAEDEGELVGLG